MGSHFIVTHNSFTHTDIHIMHLSLTVLLVIASVASSYPVRHVRPLSRDPVRHVRPLSRDPVHHVRPLSRGYSDDFSRAPQQTPRIVYRLESYPTVEHDVDHEIKLGSDGRLYHVTEYEVERDTEYEYKPYLIL